MPSHFYRFSSTSGNPVNNKNMFRANKVLVPMISTHQDVNCEEVLRELFAADWTSKSQSSSDRVKIE